MLENDSNNDVFACIQNLTIQMLVIQIKIWMIPKFWPNRIIKKLFDIMIRLGKTFSASVQAPAAIV